MARSRKKEGSVYDFMYIDAKRIGLSLSQFGTDGIVTELVRATDTTSKTGGKINFKIVGVNAEEGGKTGLVRKFDPQWLIPLIFLREAKDIVVRDIDKARIGQLVLMSGTLSVSDLSVLRTLWDVQFVKDTITQGADSDAASASVLMQLPKPPKRELTQQEWKTMRTSGATPLNPEAEQLLRILEVIKVMPHGILANLERNDNQKMWCSLREEWLIVSSSDLMLNHGHTIFG